MDNAFNDDDICYECGGYGDDYYINDDGVLVNVCVDCPHNRTNLED